MTSSFTLRHFLVMEAVASGGTPNHRVLVHNMRRRAVEKGDVTSSFTFCCVLAMEAVAGGGTTKCWSIIKPRPSEARCRKGGRDLVFYFLLCLAMDAVAAAAGGSTDRVLVHN